MSPRFPIIAFCTFVAVVACSSSETPVVDGASSGSGTSGGTSGGTSSGTTGNGTSGSSGTNDGGTTDTGTGGVACTNEDPPAAPASCTVQGTYEVTAEVKCPSCPSAVAFPKETWTVTVTGADVKMTAPNLLKKCTLSGCTCTQAGGNAYIFTATGFTGLGNNGVGSSCSYKTLEKGVRQ